MQNYVWMIFPLVKNVADLLLIHRDKFYREAPATFYWAISKEIVQNNCYYITIY